MKKILVLWLLIAAGMGGAQTIEQRERYREADEVYRRAGEEYNRASVTYHQALALNDGVPTHAMSDVLKEAAGRFGIAMNVFMAEEERYISCLTD